MPELQINNDVIPVKSNSNDNSSKEYFRKGIDNYRLGERIDFLEESLPIGKKLSGGVVIFNFPDKDMKKSLMEFYIDKREIIYKGEIIKLSLPSGAKIKSIEFLNSGIIVEGKVGFITGKGELTYLGLITAIDDVVKNKIAEIKSDSGLITLAKN